MSCPGTADMLYRDSSLCAGEDLSYALVLTGFRNSDKTF